MTKRSFILDCHLVPASSHQNGADGGGGDGKARGGERGQCGDSGSCHSDRCHRSTTAAAVKFNKTFFFVIFSFQA